MTTRTATRPDPGRALRPLRAVRAVPAHRVGRRRRARQRRQPGVDPAAAQAGHLPRRVLLERRRRHGRRHRLGAARLEPPALRGHRGADAPGTEGARFSYTPDLGVFHAVTGVHGDIMIPEDRLKAAVVKAAARRHHAEDRDRQAPRQALGRRARDVPARRRRRPGALAAPGRLSLSVTAGGTSRIPLARSAAVSRQSRA